MTTTGLIAEIVWRPAVWPSHAAAVCAALAGLTLWAYWRNLRQKPALAGPLALARLAVIVALGLVLMGPSVVPPRVTSPQRPRLYVMLDTSASMQTADAAGHSRIRYLVDRWLGEAQRRELDEAFDVTLLGFDDSARPLSPAALATNDTELAAGSTSRYAESIRDVLLNVPRDGGAAAVLVMGDGHHTAGRGLEGLATLAKGRKTTIHAVSVGSTAGMRDVAVVALPRQEYLLADEPGQVLIRVYQVGYDDQAVNVHVSDGRQTTRHTLRFSGQPTATLELPVRNEKPGTYEYSVKVEPLAGEKVTSNNEQAVFIEVSQRRMRVLVLEGEPFWDTKFLAQSLRTDGRIELAQVSRLSAEKTQTVVSRSEKGSAPGVPQTAEAWARWDVVVLGRGMEHLLDAASATALASYVDHGGRLVMARGRSYDPDTVMGKQIGRAMAVVEPVVWGAGLIHDAALTLSPAGRSTPSFAMVSGGGSGSEVVEKLPALKSVATVKQLKPATQVLAWAARPTTRPAADAEAAPAIVAMNIGRGKVFAVLGEGLWRWSFLPPELKSYKGVFDTFWSNTVRWLALGGEFQPGEDVALQLGRSSVRQGDAVAVSVSLKHRPEGLSPRLSVTDPDGVSSELALTAAPGVDNRLQAQLTPSKTGVWRVSLDAPPLSPAHIDKRLSVYNVDLERLNTAAMPRPLAALAQQTGGIYLRADQDADLPRLLERQLAAREMPPAPRYVWDQALVLAMLVTWMGLEWIARRSNGWA